MLKTKNKRTNLKRDNKIKLPNTTVYVVRPLNNGTLGNARPCDNCAKNLRAHGINKIKYTNIIEMDGKKREVLCEMKLN